MKDGYYLSTYLHINELGYIMDLPGRHDQNISLWKKDGEKVELLKYWELERVTGIKSFRKYFFNNEHAISVINVLLRSCGLTFEDMIEVWGTPELCKSTHVDYHSIGEYPEYPYHAVSHLFSSLLSNTDILYNQTIISLAVDGAPDAVVDRNSARKPFFVGCVSKKGQTNLFSVSSPGPLWIYSSQMLKLREGTLMALATACNSKLPSYTLPSLRLMDISANDEAYRTLLDLIGAVKTKYEIDWSHENMCNDLRFTKEENEISMIMKVVQELSIKIIEKSIDEIINQYSINPKETYLSLSGGYALNCPTNSYLMEKYCFKGFMSPPCVNDSGMSLGIALYAFYKQMNRMEFRLEHAYYGEQDEDLDGAVRRGGFISYIKSIKEYDVKQAVEDIKNGPIVWFNGAAEIGPRALGNRSILADPRKNESKAKLNEIKHRQWWRPVAPIVIEEAMEEWFTNSYPSPYMLNTFEIREEMICKIPAVSHLDRSARVQTVSRETDITGQYALIREFHEQTGVPMLCNTSLNDHGEPLINRIEEALNFALRKRIKIMYINKQRVELQNHVEYTDNSPYKRLQIDNYVDINKDEMLKIYNPHNLSKQIVNIFINSDLENLDIRKKEDIRTIHIISKMMANLYVVDNIITETNQNP